MPDCMISKTEATETAYAVGSLVSRFVIGMSSGERLQQVLTGKNNIAFLRRLQVWCREADTAIERLIEAQPDEDR